MRAVILKDKKITTEQYNKLVSGLSNIFVDFKPRFFPHDWDYTFYQTYIDSDGDIRPTNDYLKQVTDWVFKIYGSYGTDHVFLLIHEDNWLSDNDTIKGIWGTNYSNIYHGYQVHYCRFDRDNQANSLGTAYHELMHSIDALIQTYTNENAAKLAGVVSWDKDVVHGQGEAYDYIRHKENRIVLQKVKEPLLSAYAQRKEMYYKPVTILRQIVLLMKMLSNKKNGVTIKK